MLRSVLVVLVCATATVSSSWARGTEPLREASGTVKRVADGDTITVGEGDAAVTVRLRCVDTPEIAHHERTVQPYGPEAAEFTRRALIGKAVRLVYHRREPRDRYGRLLAYVFLDDGRLFNAELIRHGLARTTRFKCLYRKELKALETQAREQRRGLWSTPR